MPPALFTVGGRGRYNTGRNVMDLFYPLCHEPHGTEYNHCIVSKHNEWVCYNEGQMIVRYDMYGRDDYTGVLGHGRYTIYSAQKTQYKLRKVSEEIPYAKIEERLELSMSGCDETITMYPNYGSGAHLVYRLAYGIMEQMPEKCVPNIWMLEHLWRKAKIGPKDTMEVSFSTTDPTAYYTVNIGKAMYIAKPLLVKGGKVEVVEDN